MKNTEIRITDNEMTPFKFITIVTLLLLAAKLFGFTDIDWIWVLCPIWGVLAVLAVIIVIFGIVGFVWKLVEIIRKLKGKENENERT